MKKQPITHQTTAKDRPNISQIPLHLRSLRPLLNLCTALFAPWLRYCMCGALKGQGNLPRWLH